MNDQFDDWTSREYRLAMALHRCPRCACPVDLSITYRQSGIGPFTVLDLRFSCTCGWSEDVQTTPKGIFWKMQQDLRDSDKSR